MKKNFILLVEDNAAVRDALVWTLECEGYQVEVSPNGQDALDKLNNGPLPAIIFLDLTMPVLDGFEFRKKQKLNPKLKDIPTVISSGKNNLENLDRMPHEVLLPKPFALDNFFEIVKKYCD